MKTLQTLPMPYHCNVDSSSPFSSVKEAVAVFGERFLTPEVYSPKPFFFTKQETSDPSPTYSHTLVETIKKLQSELEETKEEVKLLKEREAENELALASLNAELHKDKSTIENVTAGEASRDGEERKRDIIVKTKSSLTLAQILNLTREEKEELFGGTKNERKSVTKEKPIIPLVGDLFSRKKKQQQLVL